MAKKHEKSICLSALAILLICACGEVLPEHADSVVAHSAAASGIIRQTDMVQIRASAEFSTHKKYRNAIGLRPDLPQVNRNGFDFLGLPMYFGHYSVNLCPPPCPSWVEQYTYEVQIQTCNPYGVWRYTTIYTQIQDIFRIPTTSTCYFQLPQDEDGKLVSGNVVCHGSSSTIFQPGVEEFTQEISFDLDSMTINGNSLSVIGNLTCEWGTSGGSITYPAECLADGDCGENRICDFADFTCREPCMTTACPEDSACNTSDGHCMKCASVCPEDFVCSIFFNLSGPEAVCMNNCQSEICAPGLECRYDGESDTCMVTQSELQAAEGCEPACPEGFECKSRNYTGATPFCANYCNTPGCPEEGYLCAFTSGECRMLLKDYGIE